MSENKIQILCLHGGGASNEIMQMQTAAIRYHMEDEAVFEFVEGTLPSPSGDYLYGLHSPLKVEEVVSDTQQHYFVYYDPRDVESLQSAQSDMLELLQETVFDAVLAFSEGAALAASLVMRHSANNPHAEPLFASAIFISGISPLRVAVEEPTLRRCDPALDGVRINIPTLHVIGALDYYKASSECLRGLCDSKQAIEIRHQGGHEVPKNPPSITLEIVQGIRDTISKARLRQ